MSGKIQLRIAVLAALAALTAVLVPSGLASGTDQGDANPTGLPNVGVLQLQLGDGAGQFTYKAWDGDSYEDLGSESFGPPNKCVLGDVENDWSTLSPTVGSLGQDKADLGMRDRGPRGTPCGQVDEDEGALVFELKNDEGDVLEGKQIDYAEIDLEGKHDVSVTIDAYLGVSLVGTAVAFDCTTEPEADCGNDSAFADNKRVIVAVEGTVEDADVWTDSPFDRLVIYVTDGFTGEFSLNAGTDGTPRGDLGLYLHTPDTLFHITEVLTIQCDVPANLDGVGVVGVFLKTNCDGSIRAIFSTDPDPDPEINEVSLTNVGEGIDGAYQLEYWVFDEIPTSGDTALYHNDGAGDIETPWCIVDPRDGDFTVPDNLNTDLVLPLLDPEDVSQGRHTTCRIEDNRTTTREYDGDVVVELDPTVQGEFWLFSNGDASRGFR